MNRWGDSTYNFVRHCPFVVYHGVSLLCIACYSCVLLIAVIFLYLGIVLLYPRTGPLL